MKQIEIDLIPLKSPHGDFLEEEVEGPGTQQNEGEWDHPS
jgi:hypothetical protein